jgi:bacterioferritin-associated ferredoxin
MKCKGVEKKIVLYLYDEVSPAEKRQIKKHIGSCRDCGRLIEENRQLLQVLSRGEKKEATPQWDRYWGHVIQRVNRAESKPWLARPSLRWGFTLAGFAFFLILGFLIGRIFLMDTQKRLNGMALNGQYSRQSVLIRYFEDMKPVMLDLSNTSFSDNDQKEMIDEEVIESMLIQTRLLQRRFLHQDPYVEALLTDIEMILTEVSNRVPGDRDTVKSVRDFINDRDVSIKIDLLHQRARKIRKI